MSRFADDHAAWQDAARVARQLGTRETRKHAEQLRTRLGDHRSVQKARTQLKSASSMPLTSLVDYIEKGRIDLNPPYQRGDVWTEDQRIALVYSWLTGATIPSITINDRSSQTWTDTDTYDIGTTDMGIWAVIDGRQRLTTAVMWMRGQFAVPASWFPADVIEQTEDTDDGPYVRFTGLSKRGQNRSTNRAIIPVGMGEFASLRDEARIYLLLNGGGTPQTDADMTRAAHVAGKEQP